MPLKQLHEAAVQVGAGRLDYRLHSLRPDEFGELAGAFNHMLDRLQETTVGLSKNNLYKFHVDGRMV